MLVTLKDLKPNPTRDFHVDPMIDASIENIEKSIKEDGFWGGVVCRLAKNGEIEIAAGHHRVAGALRAGVATADLFVSKDMDDAAMIRIYARENATQRGNTGTAQVGSVASAVRFLAKQMLMGVTREFPSDFDVEKALRHLTGGRGLGEPIITQFLKDVPGINENTVRQYLAILKSSGDYARIIDEVATEIEQENAAAIAAAEEAERRRIAAEKEAAEAEARRKAAADERERREAEAAKAEAERKRAEAEAEQKQHEAAKEAVQTANKAREKANGTEITFDFHNVAKVLDHAGLIEAFRKCVTSQGIQPYLEVKEQAKLAKALVKLAKDRDVELTARFITENIGNLVHTVKTKANQLKRSEKQKLLASNWNKQAAELQHQFSRQATAMLSAAKKFATHNKKRPSGVTFHASAEIRKAIKSAREGLKIIGEIV